MNKITEKSYIKVKWDGAPEEFTKEKQARIKAYIQNKYGCKNVTVQFNPINATGSEYTLDQSENIYDLANQRKLIEQFITENKLDVNIEDIMRLDDRVNDQMKQQKDVDFTYRKLKIKRIWFGPFLSFGPDNEFPVEDLSGLTVVNSIPHNFGGKTTATVDLLLYLFFNKTTKTKRDGEIFNIYLPDHNEVKVKGLIEINGVEYIIERCITRKGANKVTNSQLRIAKVVNGIEENLSEEQRRVSEKIIEETIGSMDDFLLTIIATGGNLEDLIEQKPTDRGNLLTRFIGLDLIREKEGICKEIKADWEKNIKSNQYNVVDLFQETENAKGLIITTEELMGEDAIKLELTIGEIKELDLTKEVLIGKKKPIDNDLLGVNIDEEKNKLKTIIEDGKIKKEQYQQLRDEFKTRVKPTYDEDAHDNLLKSEKELVEKIHDQKTLISNKEKEIIELERAKERTIQEKETAIITIERTNERAVQEHEKEIITIRMEHKAKVAAKNKEIKDLQAVIQNLQQGEFCPTCKRKFDNCDHSETIAGHEATIQSITQEVEDLLKTEDPRIQSIQDTIDYMKKFEDPAIQQIRSDITKLNQTEDPAIKTIRGQIQTINDVTIPYIQGEQIKLAENIDTYKKQNEALNQYEKDEIKIERLFVEIKGLAQDFKDQEDLIKRYDENVLAVTANKEIEKEIIDVNFRMERKNREKDNLIRNQQINEELIKNTKKTIDDNEKLIKIINKEQEILKIFEHYLTIFGKKGITSLILKSAIPVINSELDRLLNDTATFSMELDLNTKNDVEYWMIDRETGLKKLVASGSGYERTAAALALRAVLTKISVLPKPDMIVLDEVLGKVADENLELMKFLLDKISEMFDKVFMITHNTLVKDWGNNVVTIEKVDNISQLKFAKNISKAQA